MPSVKTCIKSLSEKSPLSTSKASTQTPGPPPYAFFDYNASTEPPAGGQVSAAIVLPGNGSQPGTTSFPLYGNGWANSYGRRVSPIDANTADVVGGTGRVLHYQNRDATSGYYQPAGEARNSLQKDGTGWTEAQADGFAFRYDLTGALQYVANRSGARWTLTHDGGGRLTRLTDPFARRTSLAYDGSGNLQ